MVALNSDFAASKPDTDAKNRVGRFFSLAAENVGEDRRSSRRYTGKNRVYRYDIASVDTEFEYGPFGELIRETGGKKDAFNFRFSTKYEDAETGLLYYGYRYYNAETGRWLSRDPIEEEGGLNLYGFVFNQPISFVDRLGLDTYAIDGTYANVFDSYPKFPSTNVFDFALRVQETSRYYPGTGVTDKTSRRGGKTFNGATGYETYLIVKNVLKQICSDRAQAQKDGRDFKINLVGWSRGATAAIWVAKELDEIDCDCDGNAESLDVNFLALYDAVEMIPSGLLVPGHRLPEWLPGDQGPPNSVPSNVQNFIHAEKTGGLFIRSGGIPLPTTNFGHPNQFGFPLSVNDDNRSNRSDHTQIGTSPDATAAHAFIINAAAAAGVPIDTSNPYTHLFNP